MESLNEIVLGACSICDGDVTIPKAWSGVVPPVPTCKACGATAKPPTPSRIVIPMTAPPKNRSRFPYDYEG